MADPTGAGSNGGTTTVVSNPPNPPTTNTVPNTTTNTTTVQYQSAIPDPNGVLAAEDAQLAEQAAAQGDAEAYDRLSTTPGNLNNPYAGLSPKQLQDLGGADPTDPYIRARLGIPQLPGSTLIATSGFGFGNLTTNLPSIDNALGTIRSLFSGTIGSLFSNKVASNTAATTGSGVAALVAPANTFTAKDTAGILAAEDAALAEQAAARGDAEAFGKVATSPVSNTTLTPAQSTANAAGTGALTAEQQLAQDQKTAADAAVLYPGSNNEALRQIDVGAGRIAANEVGIANAEKIIAANDTELADPNISDARRAELQANNIAQQEYIQAATENSIIQENIIEQNANVYAAGGGNPGDGLAPPQVNAAEDEALAQDEAAAYANLSVGPTDPYGVLAAEDEAIAQQQAAQSDAAAFQTVGPTDPYGVLAAEDEAIAQQQAAQSDAAAFQTVGPTDPYGVLAAEDEALAQDEAAAYANLSVGPTDPYGLLAAEDEAIAQQQAAQSDAEAFGKLSTTPLADQEQGSRQAAMTQLAKDQATYQARYKQPANGDWRLRLSISPNAQYLYLANPPGILAPLAATEGVIFPYTPTITTSYSANYEQYDLTHSNYRGIFYKNSRVGDITVRGTFTAQDTTEANYLLAVIHFFRSVTKMFYGQDAQRGTPPPICFLNGFGQHQFSNHSCVVSSFNYTLPNDVDYIRANGPNNFGLNLANRANPIAAAPGSGGLAGLNRLLNAIPGGLPKGGLPGNGYGVGSQSAPAGTVQNTLPVSYVPTKMEVDITLIPVQTRSQVSKQFSLQGFARGDLLRGGFW